MRGRLVWWRGGATIATELDTRWPSLPRAIAVALTAGAGFWGGLLLIAYGPLVLLPVPFGIGYVVLAGYAVRAVSCPALGVRRLIWAVSIAVQGAWLGVAISEGVAHITQKPVTPLWWAAATLGSVVALATERAGEVAPRPTAGGFRL